MATVEAEPQNTNNSNNNNASQTESNVEHEHETEKNLKKRRLQNFVEKESHNSSDEDKDREKSKKERKKKKKEKHHKKEKKHKKDKKEKGGNEEEEEEEEEEEDLDQYVPDGFVVEDDVEDEHEASNNADNQNEAEPTKKKKKKKAKKNFELDEDDLLLLEDVSGVPISKPTVESDEEQERSFKRIRKKKGNEERLSASDVKAKLQESLFGLDEEEEEAPVEQEPEKIDAEPSDEEEEEDDLHDFIVPDVMDANGEAPPVARQRKKHRNRQVMISNSQMKEAADIFGDMSWMDVDEQAGFDEFGQEDEFGEQRSKMTLEEQYEPGVLAEKFMTAEDEVIRQADIPERYQLTLPNRAPPTDQELSKEAKWIFAKGYANRDIVNDTVAKSTVTRILNVLEFIRKQNYDVPFIQHYKKDYYQAPNLTDMDIWLIYDWDLKWDHLQRRKAALKGLYEKYAKLHDESVPQHLLSLLDDGSTEVEVQDLLDHYQMYFSEDASAASEANPNKPRRAIKRDFYRICKRAGILPFAKRFGLSASQFGENLDRGVFLHQVVDDEQSPEDLAKVYVCDEFRDTDTLLRAVRTAIAMEIAHDPQVRQAVRQIYQEKAELSTFPTEKGRQTVDAFHPYRAVLRIDRKPISLCKDSKMLLILKAEKEGFITFKIELPLDKTLLESMENLYLSDGTSAVANAWNEQRREILNIATRNYLFPLLEKETRQKLAEEAKESVAISCMETLTAKLIAGPYTPQDSDSYQGESDIKAIGMCWGEGRNPTMAVAVDAEGQVVGSLRLAYLTAKPTSANDTRQEEDRKKLVKFIEDNEPQVIGIGAQLEARRLYDEVHGVVKDLRSRQRIAFTHVAYVDLQVPRIYANSERAQAEFPEFNLNQKQAVCCARYLQDPLTELCGLATSPTDLMCLKLHFSQDMLGKDYLWKMLERQFVTVVNAVGVDINRCVSFKFASGPLQFVAGLGPRKAQGLISAIYRKGARLASRAEMESMLKPVVYTNCAGFIRVLDKYFKNNEEIDPLDNTRIHPDDYNLARKIAQDALDVEDDDDYIPMIKAIMKKPGKLDDIDLDSFAAELERNGTPKKKLILYDIKSELANPYQEKKRIPYTDPPEEQLFTMLTGEINGQTIMRGQMVTAKVVSVSSRFIRCKLDSGIPAEIKAENVSKNAPKDILAEMSIEQGSTVVCRILDIDVGRIQVKLSSSSEELNSSTWEDAQLQTLQAQDPYLKPLEVVQVKKVKKKPKQSFPTRIIDHPLFQNIGFKEAEQQLADKDVGEVVIRPSSKGFNYLTITWKFYDKVFVHINVSEEHKTTKLSIGRVLKIGDEQFEDLNEILARYVEPTVMFTKDVLEFRSFRAGTLEDISRALQEEKRKAPARIPYFLHISYDKPGRFLLSYLPNKTVKTEYVGVSPEGYKFRNQKFTNPEKLIAWFKQHYKDPIPRSHREDDTFAAYTAGWGSSSAPGLLPAPAAAPVPMPLPPGAQDYMSVEGQFPMGMPHILPPSMMPPSIPPSMPTASDWTSGGWDQPSDYQSRSGPAPRRGAPKKCYNCGQEGHISKECPQPRRERPTNRREREPYPPPAWDNNQQWSNQNQPGWNNPPANQGWGSNPPPANWNPDPNAQGFQQWPNQGQPAWNNPPPGQQVWGNPPQNQQGWGNQPQNQQGWGTGQQGWNNEGSNNQGWGSSNNEQSSWD